MTTAIYANVIILSNLSFIFLFFFTEPFQYAAWEFNIEDYEEETEDFQAEAEMDEELEEEEEEEEEV